MRIYYFQCDWPSNLVFIVRCVIYTVLHSKFEENQTKTAVAIVDDKYFGQTDGHTDRQTCTSDFISVQCHALHWTDNNLACTSKLDLTAAKLNTKT